HAVLVTRRRPPRRQPTVKRKHRTSVPPDRKEHPDDCLRRTPVVRCPIKRLPPRAIQFVRHFKARERREHRSMAVLQRGGVRLPGCQMVKETKTRLSTICISALEIR